MKKVKRDQLLDAYRSGEWCRARHQRAVRPVKLHFFMDDNPAMGNTAMVTLGEMKNSEKFRFVGEGGEPPT